MLQCYTERAMETIKSNKNGNLTVFECYLFRRNRVYRDKSYWRCDDKLCSATLIKKGSDVVSDPPAHNHPPDPEKIARRKFLNKLKAAVKRQPTTKLSTIYR